jgi:CRISPR system Cascade subunit CasA
LPFNLILDPAFPILRRSGVRAWVVFADLVDDGHDPPVAFDWPRADLNVASLEFAVGVLALVFQLEDHQDWRDLWNNGIASSGLRPELTRLSRAFVLNGEGPRFLQEVEVLSGAVNPIEALFIDTPGANGQKKNADLLTHRDRYPALGLPAAAMTLYALQQFAPSGGAGNRTSMRGGGPMTTLVLPGATNERPLPLWRTMVANLPLRARWQSWLDESELARALPWLKPTLTSENDREVSEVDPAAHPLQAHFGMPRRIRLVFSAEPGVCVLTGETGPVATGFVQKPWGVNYGLWQHPLTPYRRQKEADAPYSAKPKSGHIGYRDWVGVTVGDATGALAEPARVVREALYDRASLLAEPGGETRLVASGWAMSNMEALTYLYSEQPLHLATDPALSKRLAGRARAFADAGDTAARLLRHALNDAIFDGNAKSTDTAVFIQASDAFFFETEGPFHDALDALLSGAEPDDEVAAWRWLGRLRQSALTLFDRHAPSPEDLRLKEGRERVTSAYNLLRRAFQGLDRNGVALFGALRIPVPPSEPKKRKSS